MRSSRSKTTSIRSDRCSRRAFVVVGGVGLGALTDPLGWALTSIACARDPMARGASPRVERDAPRSDDALEAEARRRLVEYPVDHDRFARRVLHTWTTTEQVDALRLLPVLLSRTASPVNGPAYFSRLMERREREHGDEVARLLRQPAFARLRFAWTSTWPTRLGWEGESYGGEIVEVVLRKEAVVARFTSARGEWDFADTDGAPVQRAAVLADPSRLGAIYFVADDPTERAAAYREYVLCNESAIESWSAGTDEIREHVQRGVEAIRALTALVARTGSQRAGDDPGARDTDWNAFVARTAWSRPSERRHRDAHALYLASLAFPNDFYRPTEQRLAVLADALRASLPRGEPLVHRPKRQFALDRGPSILRAFVHVTLGTF